MSTLTPGIISPRREVPASIPRPEYVGKPAPTPYDGSYVTAPEVVDRMRVASKLAAQALQAVGAAAKPGVTTDELDRVGHEYLIERGAYPSTLGYRGYPKSLCTSVNEVICHGIPDARPLDDGDIVKIDLTAYLDGVHGDNCATYFCGDVDDEARQLTAVTEQAMLRGIKAIKPGREVNVIGRVIEKYAARFGYSSVRDYTGHGVHSAFHSGLVIPHYDEPRYDTVIEPGMTFTVEPMITTGGYDWHQWEDGWTVVTADGSRCAQFEHTIVVTGDGAEILTLP